VVRGELDWIVMRCLEKERDRRYESAAGLAKDVQRYLAGDAVEACPPTLGYRVRKFVRKHRGPVTMGGVVAAVLLAGIAGTTCGLVRTENARARVAEEEAKVRELLAESEGNRQAAELRVASAGIDLDLKYLETDPRLGLLRLAQTLRRLPPQARALREFAAMTLIARGQELAPLVPPYRFAGGEPVGSAVLAPDGRTVVTTAALPAGVSRVWDAWTGRPRAVLREAGEEIDHTALCGDGSVACTVSADWVARFWDIPSGRLRARAELIRPKSLTTGFHPRSEGGPWILMSRDGRRLAARIPVNDDGRADPHDAARARAGFERKYAKGDTGRAWEVTVWDTATGRRLARLPRHGTPHPLAAAFSPDGRLLVTGQAVTRTQVWSADDGSLLKAFDPGPPPHADLVAAFSPSGRRLATYDGSNVWWRSAPGWQVAEGFSLADGPEEQAIACQDMWAASEDVFAVSFAPGSGREVALWKDNRRWLVGVSDRNRHPVRADDEVVAIGTDVTDFRGFRRLHPPAGTDYHPALARFAIAGRWLPVGGDVVDLAAGKRLTTGWGTEATYLPDVGLVWAGYGAAGLVPLPSRLPPDDLLERWTQVVVRGELGPGGELTAWDEATWEQKRQELAARPAPFADFPFPGRVARPPTGAHGWRRPGRRPPRLRAEGSRDRRHPAPGRGEPRRPEGRRGLAAGGLRRAPEARRRPAGTGAGPADA
jgi:hypothetical protein